MSEFKKIYHQQSYPITRQFEFSDEAKEAYKASFTTSETINYLKNAKLYYDLIQFLAHALPVREAVWWASICLKQREKDWSSLQIQAVIAAQDWVKNPQEDMRRRCELFANKLTLKCAPSWLAQAVFWNGSGSITASDQPVVLPAKNLYAKAVSGAINIAAVLPQWETSLGIDYNELATDYGIAIAQGKNNLANLGRNV